MIGRERAFLNPLIGTVVGTKVSYIMVHTVKAGSHWALAFVLHHLHIGQVKLSLVGWYWSF